MASDHKKLKDLAIATWARGGMDSLVKVVPIGALKTHAGGYVTTFKYVAGRTPAELESIMGFEANSKLVGGADIYAFTQLPKKGQFELRSYTNLPGGVPTDDPAYAATSPYVPGLGAPQWELARGVELPVFKLARIAPGQRFAYPAKSLPPRP